MTYDSHLVERGRDVKSQELTSIERAPDREPPIESRHECRNLRLITGSYWLLPSLIRSFDPCALLLQHLHNIVQVRRRVFAVLIQCHFERSKTFIIARINVRVILDQ